MTRRSKFKANKTGRNERKRFVGITQDMLEHPAYKALSSHAKVLYLYIKLDAYGDHNGRVSVTVRNAAECLNISKNTASLAFHDLQAKGFVELVEFGTLGLEGSRSSPRYGITEIPIAPEVAPRATYNRWKAGQDFAIKKHPTNNPDGWNGKTHLRN